MDFNNKYLKKYSTFEFRFKQGPPNNARQGEGESTWTPTWITEQLQPTLVQFMSQWHGSEVNYMNFYVQNQPMKISGIVEFSEELRHKIDPQRPEDFRVGDYVFGFYPRDCDSSQYQPLKTWEKLNDGKEIIKYPQSLPNERKIMLTTFNDAVDAGINLVNTVKDVGLEVYKIYKDKKDRNQTRLAAIKKTGNDISAIFKGTCNVFIYKDTDKHKGETDFYGVLYKDAFTVANTPYNIFVFREGVYRSTSKCRREHHWFASGEDNGYETLSFWKKRFFMFRHPERAFAFERQGKILSQDQLEEARVLAKNYLNPDIKKPQA